MNRIFFLAKPKVEATESSNEQSCIIGTDAEISWRFSGIEKPKVTWLFNGQSLSNNERFQIIESDERTFTLSIRAAQFNDKGVYTARAINSVGEVGARTELRIVAIKPMIIDDLQSTLVALKDESIRMKLNIDGKPRPDVIWMRNNNELTPNDNIHITVPTTNNDNTYTLTILNVHPNDQGEYFAKINNVAGSIASKRCAVTAMSK